MLTVCWKRDAGNPHGVSAGSNNPTGTMLARDDIVRLHAGLGGTPYWCSMAPMPNIATRKLSGRF